MANNDWIATLMYNQPSSVDEVFEHGITPENTDLKSIDYYKNNKTVQETFQKDGKFDEETFNTFYDSALSMYNEFSSTDWTNKVINEMAKDPFDYTQPLKTEIKDLSATIVTTPYTPDRRAVGIEGIGKMSDPVFSLREIAQDNYVRDEKGNVLDWTPNQHSGIFKSLADPTLALAVYDEDTTEVINGTTITHKKGDYKFDENGDAYYEILGNRESYGRDVLHYTDTLTVDGTTLNKFDFFDSDGLTKSIGGTLMKTAVELAPYLIPGVNTVMGAIGVVYGLASVAPTLGKAINGIFGDNSGAIGQGLTKGENFFQKFMGSQSDEARAGGFLSFESIADILSSSASQLYSQKTLGQITYSLAKMNDVQKASNLGRNLSLGFMAITSSEQTYSDFKAAGASDAAAGIGMLASIGALYGLMNQDYFRDQLFKGGVLDESEAVEVIKNWVKTDGEPALKNLVEEGVLTPKQAVKHYNAISNGITKAWQRFLSKPISGKVQSLTSSNSATKAWGIGSKMINRAFNEGVEEMMEEVSTDAVKSLFAGANALGIDVKDKNTEKLDFGFDFNSILTRYGQNFIGGFLGGAVFEGLNQYERLFGPHVVQMTDLSSNEQVMYMIATGRTNELLDRLDVLYKKGVLGDANLSATETRKRKNKEGKEETLYAKGTSDNNQNLAMYSMLKNGIQYMSNTLNDFGLNIMYGQSLLDPSSKLMAGLGMLQFDEKFKDELDKQQAEMEDLGISADEYLMNNKTNALLETIKTYQFHTSYLSDITKLGKDYLDNKSKLDKLTASKPGVSTEDEKKTESENLKKQKNVEYYTQRIKELEKQRNDLLFHRNDDRYASQVLYMTSKDLQANFEKSVLDDKEEKSYWQTSVEHYTETMYDKNFNELSDAEKSRMKSEFSNLKLADVDRLKFESDLYYYYLERMSPRIKEMNEKSKGLNENSYYLHDELHVGSKDFSQYEKNSAELLTVNTELKSVLDQSNALIQATYDELIDSGKYDSIKGKNFKELEDMLNAGEITPEVETFADLKSEVDAKLKLNTEFTAFQNQIRDLSEKQNNLQQAINRYNNIYKKYSLVSESLTELGKTELATPISNALLNLQDLSNDFDTLIGIDGTEGIDLWEYIDKYKLDSKITYDELQDVLREKIKTTNKAIHDILIDFYTKLRDKKIVSDNDIFFKRVIATACSPLSNALMFNSAFAKATRSFTGDETVLNEFKLKLLNLLTNLANGRIDVSELNKLKEEGDKLLPNLIDKVIFNASRFSNITTLVNEVAKLKESIPTLSIVDLLRNFELNVGESTIKVIDLLSQEENTLNSLGDIEKYIINNPSYDAALRNVPKVCAMLNTLLSPFNNGYTEVLNIYRKKAKKDALTSEITDVTKNFLKSELVYLTDKANCLIAISDKNKGQKITYHKNSEIVNKKSIIEGFITDKNTEGLTLSDKLKSIGLDLEDIWKNKAHGGELDAWSNITTYTTAFMDFAHALYDEVTSKKISIDSIVNTIVEWLPNDSFLNLSGSYTDNKESKNTPYANALFLASMCTVDFQDQFKKLDGIYKTYNKANPDHILSPLWGQQISNVLVSSFLQNPEIFNKITKQLHDVKVDKYIKETSGLDKVSILQDLALIENICFLPGSAGTGKTQIIDRFVVELLKANNDKSEFVVAAPHEKQIKNLQNVTGVDDKHAITISELLDKICPKRPEKFKGKALHVYDNDDINVIGTDADLYTGLNPKYLVIDEGTFISGAELQILSKWAKARGITVLMTGDYKQNGKIVEGSYSSTDDCIMTIFPELTAIIRSENSAVQQNAIASDVLTNRFVEKHKSRKDYLLSFVSEDVKDISLNLVYYEKPGENFVGCKVIKSDIVNHYVNDFANFGSDKTIAIITDDESKYKSIVSTHSNIELINADAVQGGEFDYVIVDKHFDSDIMYNMVLDFNTMLSRAKQGVVIVDDSGELNPLNINNVAQDASIASAPTAITGNATELQKWYDFVNEWLLREPETEPETEPGSGSGSKPKSKAKGKKVAPNDVIIKPGSTPSDSLSNSFFATETTSKDDEADGVTAYTSTGKSASEKIGSGVSKVSTSVETDGKVSRDRVNKSSKMSINKGNNIYYDRKAFIDELDSDKSQFWIQEEKNKYSLLNLEEFQGEDGHKRFKTFIRLFSSGVSIGMGLQQRHVEKLASYSNVSTSFAKAFCDAWNITCSSDYKLYVKAITNLDRSILYLPLTVHDKNYLIPIGTLNKKFRGVITVPQGEVLFNIATPSEMVTTTGSLDKSINKMRYGSLYSQSKVFTPNDEDDFGDNNKNGSYYKSKCRDWKEENSGKTFTAWSAIDILTDEDFDQIWSNKQTANTKTAWYTNTDIQENPEDENWTNSAIVMGKLNNRADGTEGDVVRAPIQLIDNHRVISIFDAINTAWVVKYISGLNYGILNSTQQALFSGKSKVNAINYVKGILGDFEYDLLNGGSALEQSKVNAENIYNLRTKYRLLVPAAAKHLFNSVLVATQNPKNPNYMDLCTQFEDNVFELIQREIPSKSGSGNINYPCLVVTFNKGKQYRSYAVRYDSKNNVYNVYEEILNDDNSHTGSWRFTKNKKDASIAHIPAVGVKSGGKTLYSKLQAVVEGINKTGKNKNFALEYNDNNIRSHQILFELKNEVSNPKEHRRNIYPMMDWDLIFHFFKKMPILDFDIFEDCFRETYFKTGLKLNDAKATVTDRSKTRWADLRISNSLINTRFSNIDEMLPPVYKMDMSTHPVQKIEDSDIEEIFKKSTSSEVKPSTTLSVNPLEIRDKLLNLFLLFGDNKSNILTKEVFEKCTDMSEVEILDMASELLSKADGVKYTITKDDISEDYQIKTEELSTTPTTTTPTTTTEETLESKIDKAINEKFEDAKDVKIDKSGETITVHLTNNSIEYDYVYLDNLGLISPEALAQFDILIQNGFLSQSKKLEAIQNFMNNKENFVDDMYEMLEDIGIEGDTKIKIQDALDILDDEDDTSNIIMYC